MIKTPAKMSAFGASEWQVCRNSLYYIFYNLSVSLKLFILKAQCCENYKEKLAKTTTVVKDFEMPPTLVWQISHVQNKHRHRIQKINNPLI